MHSRSPPISSQSSHSPTQISQSLHKTRGELSNVQNQIQITTERTTNATTSLHRDKLKQTETPPPTTTTSMKASLLSESPMHRLPRDIIALIASHFISTSTDIIDITPDTRNYNLWPLTRINHLWRHTILTLPHLWSLFALPNPEHAPLKLLSHVLALSQDHPLSFSIDAYPTSSTQSLRVVRVIALLGSHSERWRNVHIAGTIPASALHGIANRLPRLTHLKLDITDPENECGWDSNPSNQLIFRDAPRLRTLTITESTSLLTPVHFEFPNSQLHTVECVYRRGITYPLHLPHLTNLRTLHITCATDGDDTFEIEPPYTEELIHLPHLTSLRLEAYTPLLRLLRLLRLPSLRKLSLYGLIIDEGRVGDIRAYLDSNNNQELTSLSLEISSRMGPQDKSSVASLLSLPGFCSLHALTVKPEQNDLGWVRCLAERLVYNPRTDTMDEPSILLPRLREFTFDCRIRLKKKSVDTFRALRAFVISRTRTELPVVDASDSGHLSAQDSTIPARLETVRIKYSKKEEPITLKSIGRLMAIGRMREDED